MKIDSFSNIDQLINEKQIQPSGGKREGKVLLIGGSPGAGKNWALENLTDVINRYKIFDIDSIKEIMTSFDSDSKLIKRFKKYILDSDKLDPENKKDIVQSIDNGNFFDHIKILKRNDMDGDLLHDFLIDTGIFSKSIINFIEAIAQNKVKPNIALNSTLRNVYGILYVLEQLEKKGYDLKNKVDIIWVVTSDETMVDNISKRQHIRHTDMEYVMKTKDSVNKNMMDILNQTSYLDEYVNNMYVVMNEKHLTTYYDNTDVIKDFFYIKVDPKDKSQVENLKQYLFPSND